MKRIICFIMMVAMLMSMLGITANATTFEEQLAYEFYIYCGGNEADWNNPNIECTTHIYEYAETQDAVFFSGFSGWREPENREYLKKFGNWCVYSSAYFYPSDSALYVKIGEEIYTLEEAWENSLVTDLSCIEGFSRISKVYRVGDADLDFEVSILDATLIQLSVAQLSELDYLQSQTADVDGDGEISVLDATTIQLKLAGLE